MDPEHNYDYLLVDAHVELLQDSMEASWVFSVVLWVLGKGDWYWKHFQDQQDQFFVFFVLLKHLNKVVDDIEVVPRQFDITQKLQVSGLTFHAKGAVEHRIDGLEKPVGDTLRCSKLSILLALLPVFERDL